MSNPVVTHRLDRMLVSVVETLSDEFPELPVAVITRCVQAVRSMVHTTSISDVEKVARAIEQQARDDLRRIDAALASPPVQAVAR